MSPRIKLPEHIKSLYAKNAKAEIKKSLEIRRALSEYSVKQRQELRKYQEGKAKAAVMKYNTDRVTQGSKARDDIKMYTDEGFAYSIHLAKQTTRNRIEVLELDRAHYAKEVARFEDKEVDSGERYSLTDELSNTLNAINDELNELKIDLEVSPD